jgi:hypothetical protein
LGTDDAIHTIEQLYVDYTAGQIDPSKMFDHSWSIPDDDTNTPPPVNNPPVNTTDPVQLPPGTSSSQNTPQETQTSAPSVLSIIHFLQDTTNQPVRVRTLTNPPLNIATIHTQSAAVLNLSNRLVSPLNLPDYIHPVLAEIPLTIPAAVSVGLHRSAAHPPVNPTDCIYPIHQ